MMSIGCVRSYIGNGVTEKALEHDIEITPEVRVKIIELLSDTGRRDDYVTVKEANKKIDRIYGQLEDFLHGDKIRYA